MLLFFYPLALTCPICCCSTTYSFCLYFFFFSLVLLRTWTNKWTCSLGSLHSRTLCCGPHQWLKWLISETEWGVMTGPKHVRWFFSTLSWDSGAGGLPLPSPATVLSDISFPRVHAALLGWVKAVILPALQKDFKDFIQKVSLDRVSWST